MDNILVWNEKKKWVCWQDAIVQINEKPELGFDYDELNSVNDKGTKVLNGKSVKLKKTESEAIIKYLSELGLIFQKAVLGVDEKGRYLDRCKPEDCYAIVHDTPMNAFDYIWDFEAKKWKEVVPVDKDGKLCGPVWDEKYFASADSYPLGGPQKWVWNFDKKVWEDSRPIEEQKLYYREKISNVYKSKLFSLGYDFSMEAKYKAKYQEALAYKKAKFPAISKEYPYIYHESLYSAVDAKAVAETIISKHEATDHNIHVLEALRLAANKKLEGADTQADMEDAVKVVNLFTKDSSL